jgi:hypothetical protein
MQPSHSTSSGNSTLYFAYGSNLSPTQMRIRCYNDASSSVPIAVARLDKYKWIICERGYANVVPVSPHAGPEASPSSLRAEDRVPTTATASNEAEHSTLASTLQPEDVVYGLIYPISELDEARLDLYEGHNSARNPHPTPNPDQSPEAQRQKPFLQGGWDYNKHYLSLTITKWLVDDPGVFGVTTTSGSARKRTRGAGPSGMEGSEQLRALVYVDEYRTKHGVISHEYIARMNRAIRESVDLGVPAEWVEEVMRRDIPADEDGDGYGMEEGYVGDDRGYVEEERNSVQTSGQTVQGW